MEVLVSIHFCFLINKEKGHVRGERWGAMTYKSREKSTSFRITLTDGSRKNIKQAILRHLPLLCIITDQWTAASNIYTAPDQASKERWKCVKGVNAAEYQHCLGTRQQRLEISTYKCKRCPHLPTVVEKHSLNSLFPEVTLQETWSSIGDF